MAFLTDGINDQINLLNIPSYKDIGTLPKIKIKRKDEFPNLAIIKFEN